MTAWTQTQLDVLERAIATGQRSVSYDGLAVTYGSIDDMLRVRAEMRRALGLSSVNGRTYAIFDRAT